MGINNNSIEIIKFYKLFGLSLYESQRLSNKKNDINFEPVHCNDIGIYVIGKYPRLKFGNFTHTEDLNWNRQAIATIRLTILNQKMIKLKR